MANPNPRAFQGLFWLVLIGGGWLYFFRPFDQLDDPSNYPKSEKSYADVVNDVGCRSKATDAKKKEIWDRDYYHHWVTWQGTVYRADASWIQVNVSALSYDFETRFQDSRAGIDLTEGDGVTVRFVLTEMGDCSAYYRGTHGQLVSRVPAAQIEAAKAKVDADKAAARHNSCEGNWSKCADNADLANHDIDDWTRIGVECQDQANLKARYGKPVWPWLSFESFRPGKDYVASGVVTAIEPDAQFQNQFGAMVHSHVYCTYDLRNRKVINVDIIPDYNELSAGAQAREKDFKPEPRSSKPTPSRSLRTEVAATAAEARAAQEA